MVAATAAVFAPVVVGGAWRGLALAAVILGALTAIAARAGGAATVRAVVFLDVVFVIFAGGSLWAWTPAVTTVLVCTVPLVPVTVRPTSYSYSERPSSFQTRALRVHCDSSQALLRESIDHEARDCHAGPLQQQVTP